MHWFLGAWQPHGPVTHRRIGHPKRDRSAIKANRRAARRNRRH